MNQTQRLTQLLDYFLSENPEHQNIAVPQTESEQKKLLRGLMNLRPALPFPQEMMDIQDQYLQAELAENILDFSSLSPVEGNLYLWQGDITRLHIDGIVNAGNSALLGCFYPCHGCIDNVIHSFSGVQLRLACAELMEKQGHPESTGCAKITPGFNLPCNYVLHTVGPIVQGALEDKHREALKNSYLSCLRLATEQGLNSLAFCCISTGEFRFPQQEACDIAVSVVREYVSKTDSKLKVLFNVFQDEDMRLYAEKFK